MKRMMIVGFLLLFVCSCIREGDYSDVCPTEVVFEMKDVPYIFDGGTAVGFQPYYAFVEQLEILAFSGKKLHAIAKYDYTYCREHPEIPFDVETEDYTFLFVSNLFDHKAMVWNFEEGNLVARFSILENQEPPVILVAESEYILGETARIPVPLTMLVSRLEIRLENPPAWVTGLDVDVAGVARTITNGYVLSDTTHILKSIALNNTGPGTYWFGVNTFPTYLGMPAKVNIRLVGTDRVSTYVVEDSRLHLVPGVVTRLDIRFNSDETIGISVGADGKWEVNDEGKIII